jgi:hypothetical protein
VTPKDHNDIWKKAKTMNNHGTFRVPDLAEMNTRQEQIYDSVVAFCRRLGHEPPTAKEYFRINP